MKKDDETKKSVYEKVIKRAAVGECERRKQVGCFKRKVSGAKKKLGGGHLEGVKGKKLVSESSSQRK